MTAEERARRIKIVLMDVDGTLTDGSLIVTAGRRGAQNLSCQGRPGDPAGPAGGPGTGDHHRQDVEGPGEESGEASDHGAPPGRHRQDAGSSASILEKRGLDPAAVAYIGDDLGDLAVMRSVGLAAAVADAHPRSKSTAITSVGNAGGRGAVRELIEFILKAQGKWEGVSARVS